MVWEGADGRVTVCGHHQEMGWGKGSYRFVGNINKWVGGGRQSQVGEQHPKMGWSEDINGCVDYINKWVRWKTVIGGWTTSTNGLEGRQLRLGGQYQ